ncbi:MAG: polyprenyl synthetase family protein [Planctomycetota bacterium]|nr:MAG: polyprenyl synthetase family protein [Planctomycetota bacterium]
MTTSAANTLEAVWSSHRRHVDDALRRYLDLPAEHCPQRLAEAMRYSVLAPGKRLRPLLVLLANETCGGDPQRALPAACAVEMVHAYSLIHDDLPAMDDDDLRRGRPTNHKVFGEALAILAGDALLTLAFEVLARDVRPADVAAACCARLAEAAGACGMVGGQAADLEAEQQTTVAGGGADSETVDAQRTGVRLRMLESIHRRKTGALLSASLDLGALTAGASAEQRQSLQNYGTAIGLAFQIVDDLLDVCGDTAKMGKRVRKDAGHGKLTYPGLLGVEESRRRAAALVEQAVAALAPFGSAASRLEELARFIVQRDH